MHRSLRMLKPTNNKAVWLCTGQLMKNSMSKYLRQDQMQLKTVTKSDKILLKVKRRKAILKRGGSMGLYRAMLFRS